MPSKSLKQAKTMRAAAHNPEFSKKVGIPQSVAKDFASADKSLGKFQGKGKFKKKKKKKAKRVKASQDWAAMADATPQESNAATTNFKFSMP